MAQRTPEEIADDIEESVSARRSWQEQQHQAALGKLGELFAMLAKVQARYDVNCVLADDDEPPVLVGLAGNTYLFSWWCEGQLLMGKLPDRVMLRRAKTVSEAFEQTVWFLSDRRAA